ncbi:MAG: type II toxin-antitoxin system HipA family toxin YjjJ [Proteobacteria bacterium]|nr:type II toxin-antitoxin system HipA family toxin YjjJ [Pseudomonadota bacterium]
MDRVTEPLLAKLRLGPRSTLELAQSLGASEPTVLRALRAMEREQRVVRLGKTKGARYALRRSVGAIGSRWPLFRVDARGAVQELGMLEALERDSYRVSAGPARMQPLVEGIPYFLQDGRPAGFLGRAIPRVFPELNLPDRVVDWNDEHALVYLARRAPDMPGALIVGAESMDRYLAGLQAAPLVSRNERVREYPRYAGLSMEGAPPGSSAQGEQPKFTARIEHNSQRIAVIVKFSPPLSTVTGRRWGDLLRAEYLAHRVLSEHGIAACRSELLQYDERVFLECERFDRVGAEGRRSTVSLFALDTSRYGQLDSWTAAAERLAADRLLSATDADQIRLLDAFGALIANTDRHFGNITLFDEYDGPFTLAPAYDMLPMLFAPQNEQIVPRVFEPPAPRSSWLPVWSRARALAETYWQRLAEEPTLSDEFRALCMRSLEALRALPIRGAIASGDLNR